jgi:hypothetical protein
MDKRVIFVLAFAVIFLIVVIVMGAEINNRLSRITIELPLPAQQKPPLPLKETVQKTEKKIRIIEEGPVKSRVTAQEELQSERAFVQSEEAALLSASHPESTAYPQEEVPLFPGWEEEFTPQDYPSQIQPPPGDSCEEPPLTGY